MIRSILFVILLVIVGTVSAEVRPEYSGAWYNPSQSGHGFSVEVIDSERSIAFWYAYDPEGKPIFLLASGTNVGNRIVADVYYYEGMIWGEFDPTKNVSQSWGTLTITFQDCKNASLTYDSTMTGYGSGQMPLYHLASVEGFRCTDFPLAGAYSGFALSEVGYGIVFGYGLVNEQGVMHFFSSDGVFVTGDVNASSGETGSVSANGLSAYFDGGSLFTGNFSASGWFTPDLVRANYSASATGDRGVIELHRMDRITGTAISLSELTGSWNAYNFLTGLSQSLTIQPNGTFSVVDTYGCRYDGRISIPNPELALLSVTAEVSGCDIAGDYVGDGIYSRAGFLLNVDAMHLIGWSNQGGPAVLQLSRN